MRDAGHRTPDAGHRTSDIGHRTSDGEKSKNNISTPQGGGHNYLNVAFISYKLTMWDLEESHPASPLFTAEG